MTVRSSQCRSCKRVIVWTRTANGKRLPLDARAITAYTIRDDIEPRAVALGDQGAPLYVSHFLTCPQANEWGKSDGG